MATNEDNAEPSKSGKKRSIAWDHFDEIEMASGNTNTRCKHCGKSYRYKSSTGSMLSHLKSCEKKILHDQQKHIELCSQEMAKLIIKHEYFFRMAEDPGFAFFVQTLQPQFKSLDFDIVKEKLINTFESGKQNLKRVIEGIPGRISLSLDVWNSSRSISYVLVSGSYIDENWKLQQHILSVIREEPDAADRQATYEHAVGVCCEQWGLENRLMSITSKELIARLSIKPLILIDSCLASTLTAMAQEVLIQWADTIVKIRGSLKALCSPNGTSYLKWLDNYKNWNTTYEMLVACSGELKHILDSDPPTAANLEEMVRPCEYLKIIFDAANTLTGSNTTNIVLLKLWDLHDKVGKLYWQSSNAEQLNCADQIDEIFWNYWTKHNVIFSIIPIMDPRKKKGYIVNDNAAVNEKIRSLFRSYGNGEGENAFMFELDQYLEEPLLADIEDLDILQWWREKETHYPTLSLMARDILSMPLSTAPPESVFDTVVREMDDYRVTLPQQTMEALILGKSWLEQDLM